VQCSAVLCCAVHVSPSSVGRQRKEMSPFRLSTSAASGIRKSITANVSVPHHDIIGQQQQQQRWIVSRRHFSVKELPWCAPKESPTRLRSPASSGGDPRTSQGTAQKCIPTIVTHKFGIVAAMAANSRVIGIQGKLPWKHLPTDRKLFDNLTRNKVLIIGRRTLLEQPNLEHIQHVKYCIVVSNTIASLEDCNLSDDNDSQVMLKFATSLEEALEMAHKLTSLKHENDQMRLSTEENTTINNETNDDGNNDDVHIVGSSDLECWVAGGEQLYKEALKHNSATELHLTVVDTEIDNIASLPLEDVAKFPAKYRWDHNYKVVKEHKFLPSSLQEGEPTFTYYVYKRMKRNLTCYD